MEISVTKHFKNNNMAIMDLDLIIDLIQQECYSEVIEKIRLLRAIGDEASNDEADKLKNGLIFFMPSLLAKNKASDKVRKGSKPTGLIQFDIDLKHNLDLDLAAEMSRLKNLPYVIYAFKSPSGGLKFAIKSNFRAKDGESWKASYERFKQAYHIAKRELKKHVDAVYDDVTQSIQQGCFVSSDADTYYNPNATEFDVGELVYHEVFDHSDIQDTSTGSHGPSLEALLSFIDKDLGYMERLPIICGALSVYGQECIPALVNHFNVENSRLRRQIEKIYKHDRFGSYVSHPVR